MGWGAVLEAGDPASFDCLSTQTEDAGGGDKLEKCGESRRGGGGHGAQVDTAACAQMSSGAQILIDTSDMCQVLCST